MHEPKLKKGLVFPQFEDRTPRPPNRFKLAQGDLNKTNTILMPTPKNLSPNSRAESVYVVPYIQTEYRGTEGDAMEKPNSHLEANSLYDSLTS